MHAKLGTFVVFACKSFIKSANLVLYSSMFCRIFSTVLLKFELVSSSISYATMQSNKFVGMGRTLARSHPAASKWKPESSLFSLMWTFGRSSILVCCDKCKAASQAPLSCSVSGNIECLVQHRASMGAGFDSFIHTIVLDQIMIVSGVEYIKDVLFLCMAANTAPAAAAPKGWYFVAGTAGPDKAVEMLKYEDVTWFDASDALFWSSDNVEHSRANWTMMMTKRGILKVGEKRLNGIVIDLRSKHSKPAVDTKTVVTVITDDNLTSDTNGCAKYFRALTKECRDIFAHLKQLVAEITELQKAPPPAPAAAAGVLSATDKENFETMKKALGPWANTIDIQGSLETLVEFEANVTSVLGRDHPAALKKLRALVALEAGAKAALPDAAADEPAALLKKIQETEQQLKANKVILDEYTAKKIEIQELLYGEKEWSNVVPKLTAVMKINDQINQHIPPECNPNGTLDIGKWRKEFDDRQVKIEAYAKTQLEVQKALYDRPSWDDVLPEIAAWKGTIAEAAKQTPKVYHELDADQGSNRLHMDRWRAEYDRLVSLRDAMWATCTPAFQATTKIEDVAWVDEYKNVTVIMDRWISIEAELLKIFTPVPLKDILPAIRALVKMKIDIFAAIPQLLKKDVTIEKITECVGHWSAAWTELVAFRKHVHTGLLFKEPKDNTDILAKFDDWMTDLKGIYGACGVTLTVKQCPQLLKDIQVLVLPGDLGGSVAQIRTWKDDVARLTKLITDGEEAAKKAAVDAAGGDGAAAAAAEATRKENVRLASELGACEAKLGASEDLVKAAQAKLGVSEDHTKALQGANDRLEGLVAAGKKEISELTTHLTDGRTSAPRVDVADRVQTLLGELNNLMPGHLTDRVDQALIVAISEEIVANFTGYELKDVITRLVSQLESAVHPGVRGESVRGMLASLEELWEKEEKTGGLRDMSRKADAEPARQVKDGGGV
jgi:hypothetical protein